MTVIRLPTASTSSELEHTGGVGQCAGSKQGDRDTMRNMRRAIVVALTVGAVGCGYGKNKGDDTNVQLPPAAPAKPADPKDAFGITYTVNFGGPMALSGSSSQPVARVRFRNCMDYVLRHNEGHLDIEGRTGGHDFQVGIEVPMSGPGTFTPPPDAVVNLVFDSDNSRYQFGGFAKTGSTKIVVNPDGSGTLTFSNWENDSREKENGTVTWSCGPWPVK
jgi:hypothetical protein